VNRTPGVLTALVVDDSSGARRRVGTMLQLGGWQVHQAIGTEAALRVADAVDLDLVVTDIAMRGGNGAALLHRLRNEGCRARSIVVASRPTELVGAQARAAGAMACLAKPVDPRLFLDLMHDLSGGRAAAGPVVRQEAAPSAIHVHAERLDRAQAGHAEVAWVSQGITTDAGRGVLSHARLMQLVALSAMTDRGRPAPTGQATSR
jgi:CheY-like chemotaxis protein